MFRLLSLQDGAAAVDRAFGASKSESDFGVGGGADQFIFGGGPFPKAQSGLGDAECATLLPDRTEGTASEFGHLGVGLGAQEGEFVFGPWPGVALHRAAVVCGAGDCEEKDRDWPITGEEPMCPCLPSDKARRGFACRSWSGVYQGGAPRSGVPG